VTNIYRREADGWKIVHHHTDFSKEVAQASSVYARRSEEVFLISEVLLCIVDTIEEQTEVKRRIVEVLEHQEEDRA
jgi:hypothetical protein